MTHDPLPPEDSVTGYSRPDGYVNNFYMLETLNVIWFHKRFYKRFGFIKEKLCMSAMLIGHLIGQFLEFFNFECIKAFMITHFTHFLGF